MAGHSKWANIQHRKKAQDAKRGKIFTRLIREVTVAARMGGGDVESNPRLRAAVDTAKAANMANDTINRAVMRGAGGLDGSDLEEVCYEGYGIGGIAVMVECMTDNRNRTVAEVRHAFSKRGGNLGAEGSVAYLFRKVGQLLFAPGVNEEVILEVALAAGAEDVVAQDDGSVEVITAATEFLTVKEALVAADLPPDDGEVTMLPSTTVELDGEDAEKTQALLEMLDGLDDVQHVYTNARLPEEY